LWWRDKIVYECKPLRLSYSEVSKFIYYFDSVTTLNPIRFICPSDDVASCLCFSLSSVAARLGSMSVSCESWFKAAADADYYYYSLPF